MAEPSIQLPTDDRADSHSAAGALPVSPDPVTQKPRSRWRRLRILLGILMLATGAGTAYYFYASAVAEKRLEKALAEADRLEPGWRLADILRKQPRIADKDKWGISKDCRRANACRLENAATHKVCAPDPIDRGADR
jgi:hypothetical protein